MPSPTFVPRSVAVLVAAVVLSQAAPLRGQDVVGPSPEWQQEIGYTMEAYLDEEADVLRGAARVRYGNASPDTLEALYFHLYLNAFRPGSVWARTEERQNLDFAALEEPDYGFERLSEVRVGGREIRPAYPHAPDSTVVRFDLPAPLAPGEETVVDLEWEARPSTLCRRQCREGRSWDLAQWYPRVAVYDQDGWQAHPLYPQGEFYGEFATWDVTLDLAADQVVGATGVPVTGDPGWRPGPGSPLREVEYQRDAYGQLADPPPLGLLEGAATEGRKRIRFHAEKVHHFAWSTSPEYLYEAARFESAAGHDVIVHVLFRPGDLDWDLGAAALRTVRTLGWLEETFGPYPYPQLTNLHRLEGGGTEFPMVIMDGNAGQGLIAHEGIHQYVHGILGNNEWREAWLDEGLTSFLTSWFMEDHGVEDPWSGSVRRMGTLEAQAAFEHPVATVSEAFPSYQVYGILSYTKPSVIFYMLREMVGAAAMREILRTYYDRHRFSHVTEADFRRAAEDVYGVSEGHAEELGEEASGRDLDWFFDQWLHTTATLDYRVGEVSMEALPDGRYRARVEVVREGDAWMPVTVEVGEVRGTLRSRDRVQTMEVITEERPDAVVLDPDVVLLDTNRENNRKEL